MLAAVDTSSVITSTADRAQPSTPICPDVAPSATLLVVQPASRLGLLYRSAFTRRIGTRTAGVRHRTARHDLQAASVTLSAVTDGWKATNRLEARDAARLSR
jgi:hypothetical protein